MNYYSFEFFLQMALETPFSNEFCSFFFRFWSETKTANSFGLKPAAVKFPMVLCREEYRKTRNLYSLVAAMSKDSLLSGRLVYFPLTSKDDVLIYFHSNLRCIQVVVFAPFPTEEMKWKWETTRFSLSNIFLFKPDWIKSKPIRPVMSPNYLLEILKLLWNPKQCL